jgi:hypothetical protein
LRHQLWNRSGKDRNRGGHELESASDVRGANSSGPLAPARTALSALTPVQNKRPANRLFCYGAYRDRTGDLRLAKPALSQLS